MDSADCIDQIGIVEEVKENSILVRFQSAPACGSCLAKSVCSPGSAGKNLIKIHQRTDGYSMGDPVKILISVSMGFRALFLGYLLPFLMVVFFLLLTKILGFNELISGLISLSGLLPYYLTLYLFRERVNKKFIFTLTKLN
ncbi:MAG TPA: SoxR reducing system RseC family protein [Bacteroidales bacterium]|nr:SoxR reducing system RseC family protein [Bacteroidales bacterium]